jgi:glyoxylase-like metal-dependent hydrolase (beta-lactamase superfamily II)
VERTLLGRTARFEGGLQEVAAGAYAWLQPNGEWGESNAGLVVGDRAALLLDTLWDPPLTRRMLDAMSDRVDAPIELVVNTHSDGDHVWGNQLLEGAEIVATEAAIELIRHEPPEGLQRFKSAAPRLKQLGALPLPVIGSLPLPLLPRLRLRELGAYVERMLAPYDFSDVRLTPPGRGFSGELTVEAGGRGVGLIEVGPAHTAGDLIAHVPDVRVVFAADVLFIGVVPVMWAGPTSNWITALDRILSLDPEVIVPGHGPLCTAADVAALRDYLSWVETEATLRLARGASVMDTARDLVLDEEYRSSAWANWDSPERIVITVATIDRHRRGEIRGVGTRERAELFARVATLAAELDG